MTTSTPATARNDNNEAQHGRSALASETRLATGAIDDEVEAVFASLSYLLDGGEPARELPPDVPGEPEAQREEADILQVDEDWLEPGLPVVTARVLINQHTMATLRPERLEVPADARPSPAPGTLLRRSREVLAPLMGLVAPPTPETPPETREAPPETREAPPETREAPPVVEGVATGPEAAPEPAPAAAVPPLPEPSRSPLPPKPAAPPTVRTEPLPSGAAPVRPRSRWSGGVLLGAAMVACVSLGAQAHRWFAPEAPVAPLAAPVAVEAPVAAAASPAPAPAAAVAPLLAPTVAAMAATAPVPAMVPAPFTAPAAVARVPAAARVAMSPEALSAALKRMLPSPVAPPSAEAPPPPPAPVAAATRPAAIPSTGPVVLEDR